MIKPDKGKLDFINVCKYGMVLIFVIYIVALLMADRDSHVPYETVEEKVLAAANMDNLVEADALTVRKCFGIYPEDMDGITLYLSKDAMGVSELLLVHAKDRGQMEQVEAAAQERIANQLHNFEGYGTKQTKLLEQAVVDRRGTYLLMVVSEDAKKIQRVFEKAL